MRYYRTETPVFYGTEQERMQKIETAIKQLWSRLNNIEDSIKTILTATKGDIIIEGSNIKIVWENGILRIMVYDGGEYKTVIEGGL